MMVIRRDWYSLPEEVRRAVEARTGVVLGVDSPVGGRNSEVAVVLRTAGGAVFCKGVAADSPLVVMHRNEIRVSPYLPPELAPRLLWHLEAEGWLLLGFEFVRGRHAGMGPGSPDLGLVAEAVTVIGATVPPPPGVARRSMAGQWARVLEAEFAAGPVENPHPWSREHAGLVRGWAGRASGFLGGDTLLHTDLNPANFLVADTARVVDWA